MECDTLVQNVLSNLSTMDCEFPPGVSDPYAEFAPLKEHYLDYLIRVELRKGCTLLPGVALRIQAVQPTWQQLVETKPSLWVFRDHPERLRLAPEIAGTLQKMEREAAPIYSMVQWLTPVPTIPKGCTLAVAPLYLEIVGDRPDTHTAALVWDSGVWEYIEPNGPDAGWASAVVSGLSPLGNVTLPTEWCPAGTVIQAGPYCAHFSMLYTWLRLQCPREPVWKHMASYSRADQGRIVTAFTCHMWQQLESIGVTPSTLPSARKRISKTARGSILSRLFGRR